MQYCNVLNHIRVFHLPPTQVGHAGVSASRHSANAELLVVYCRFWMFKSAQFSLGDLPSLKNKERNSEVLTGQTGTISGISGHLVEKDFSIF